jgi:hypothetical protein
LSQYKTALNESTTFSVDQLEEFFFLKNKIEIPTIDKKTTLVITRDQIKEVYPSLNLIQIGWMLKAHKNVLEHGIATGTEKIQILSMETGKVVYEKIGTADTIDISDYGRGINIGRFYNGSVMAVHNHLLDLPLSYADISSFSKFKNMCCLGACGHGDTMYSFTRNQKKCGYVLHEILVLFQWLKFDEATKSIVVSDISRINLFNDKIALKMNWKYMIGGKNEKQK